MEGKPRPPLLPAPSLQSAIRSEENDPRPRTAVFSLLSRVSQPGWAAVGSLSAGFAAQGILVISGILLARTLGPESRGYLALFILIALAISQVGQLGLPVATAYYIARNPLAARSIVRRIRGFVLAQCLLLTLLQAAVIAVVFRDRPASVHTAALVSLSAVFSTMLHDYGLTILQGQQRFLQFNLLRILPGTLNALAAIVVWAWKADLVATTALLMLSTGIAGMVMLSVALSGLRQLSDLEPSPSRSSLLRFGAQSLIGSLYPTETFRLEQFLIGLLLAPAALGIYVVALAFTNLPRFVAQSLGMVAYPRIAGQDPLAQRRSLAWRYFWASAALASLTVAALELTVDRLVPILFGQPFMGAIPVARVLLVGALFLSGRRILAEGLKGAGYPAAGTVAEVVSLLVLFGALIPFTQTFGLVGVAVAVTISGAASLAILLWFQATRLRPGSILPVTVAEQAPAERNP